MTSKVPPKLQPSALLPVKESSTVASAGSTAFRSPSNRSLASLFRLARSAASPPPTDQLIISSPTDPEELEAERIAGEVMSMPVPSATLHRKCAACEEEEGKVHRSADFPSISSTHTLSLMRLSAQANVVAEAVAPHPVALEVELANSNFLRSLAGPVATAIMSLYLLLHSESIGDPNNPHSDEINPLTGEPYTSISDFENARSILSNSIISPVEVMEPDKIKDLPNRKERGEAVRNLGKKRRCEKLYKAYVNLGEALSCVEDIVDVTLSENLTRVNKLREIAKYREEYNRLVCDSYLEHGRSKSNPLTSEELQKKRNGHLQQESQIRKQIKDCEDILRGQITLENINITTGVQRSKTGDTISFDTASHAVHQTLSQPGQPLAQETRAFFEPRFAADLSHVRIHDNSQAAYSASAVHAKAYTVGHDIAFASGQYSPHSEGGKGLLAHELAHVIQGQAGRIARQEEATGGMTSADAPMSVPGSVPVEPRQSESRVRFQVQALTSEEFQALTGVSADTIPEGQVTPITQLPPPQANVRQFGPSASSNAAPAFAASGLFAPTPWSFIPTNATGILSTRGHVSIWSNPQTSLFPTIRGFRGNLTTYAGESLPGIGQSFTIRLHEGVPGSFANDAVFPFAGGEQSYLYVVRDSAHAEAFAARLRATNYSQDYRYSPPRSHGDPVLGQVGDMEVELYEVLMRRGQAPMSTNNCTTVPAAEIEAAIDMRPRTQSGIDVISGTGPDGVSDPSYRGRNRLTRDAIQEGPLAPGVQRLNITAGAARSMAVIKVGGVLMLLYGAYQTGNRVYEASGTDQFGTVVAEESGSWIGGALGSALGGAAAGAIFCAPTGPVTAVCVVGGFIGGLIVGYAGATVGSEIGYTAATGQAPQGGIIETVTSPVTDAMNEFASYVEFEIRKLYFGGLP